MSNLVKGIISFPQVFEPRAAVQGSEPRFSVQVLLEPGDPQIQQIQQQIEQAKADTWPSGAPGNLRTPLQPYDDKYAGKNYYDPQFSGWYVLTCNAKQNDPPAVVNEQRQPIIDRGEVFSGVVAQVAHGIAGYNQGAQGIGGFLNGLLVTNQEPPKGRLDGKPSVDQMFAQAPASTAQAQAEAPVAPPAAPAAPPAAPSGPVMTDKAQFTHEQYKQAGWTDQQLIDHGLLQPPQAAPSFSG